MSSTRRTRIAVIDDHQLFAESIALALEFEGYSARRIDLEASGSLAVVLSTVLRSRPHIVLLDLRLGALGEGMRLIDPLTAAGCHVIVVTSDDTRAHWGECLRRGAVQIRSKAAPLSDVVSTVRRVSEGLPVMTRDERQELIELWHRDLAETQAIRNRLERLTGSEQEILDELMQGHQVREIAHHRVVTEATVRTQVKSILAKLETSSQIGAVGVAHRVGWHHVAS